MKSSFSIFSFMNCALGVTSENSLANWRPLRFFPLFIFSNWFAFYIRSMTYVELFFGKDIRSVSRFFFHVGMQLFQHHLLKRLSFLCWITSALCQRSVDFICVSLFLGSLLCSMHLFVYSFTGTTVLIAVTF